MEWLNKTYKVLEQAVISVGSAVISIPIGAIFISILGGVFQIIITVIGAVLAFLAVEYVKKLRKG